MNEPTPQEQEPIMKIPSLSKLPRRLLPLVAALALAGCASVSQSLPEVPAAPAFKEQGAAPQAGWTQALPAEAQARGQWWLAFADPALDALVDKATLDNQGIQAAAARLAEARALARSANAERLPQIGVGAGATRGAGLDKASGTRPATLVNAGLNLSYEVDLFGRISQAADASRLDAEGLEALLQSTRLAVQAEVAQTYLQLRALDAERALVEHALAVLVGDSASRFGVSEGAWTTALPSIPAGVPATVLMRRPDISAAQRAVFAAQSRVGVAKTAWFPSISLTGAAGHASPEVGDLFKWSMRSWGVGALLSLPLFDGGRREAGVQAALR
jgi:multidrug efflux system outer membrane protein